MDALFFFQKKGYYRAKHNSTGEEGLINSENVRERHALRVVPSLSLMPYVMLLFVTACLCQVQKLCGCVFVSRRNF